MLAIIAGCIMYMTGYRYWFALHDYRIEAQSQELEARLWEVFPKRSLKFWPYFVSDRNGMKDFLERDMPVTVDTSMKGMGKFTTTINWLKAWVKVNWRGKIWCISRDGRMWQHEPGRAIDDEAGNLIWRIPEEGNLQGGANVQPPMFGVFKSPISTEVIASFLDDFSNCRWFSAAIEVTWERRAGMDLFVLQIANGNQRFELYLQPDKYRGQDIGTALDDLFARLADEGGNHIIDATYEGKILLRKL